MRNFARLIYNYLISSKVCAESGANSETLISMWLRLPQWLRSLRSSPLADHQPWMTFTAIQFLDQFLEPPMRVFEWGSGGSTLFFAKRVTNVTTVEHDTGWSKMVEASMHEIGQTNWQLHVVEPTAAIDRKITDPSDPASYASAVELYRSSTFEAYATIIDQFSDLAFDVVVVDGRSRTSCAFHGIPKVKPGGILVLDDADRPRYNAVHAKLTTLGWTLTSFAGPGPYMPEFRQTAVWKRP